MSIDVEFAIKKDIRNNAVVRELDTGQKREFRGIVWLAIVSVALVLFSAREHFQIRSRGMAIETLRTERERETIINRQLRLNLEAARTPERVDARAQRELGLVPPTDRDTIILEHPQTPPASGAMVALAR